VAGPDFAAQIKQLDATMHTIEQVLDLDRMRTEIAELQEQASSPDLWSDQATRSASPAGSPCCRRTWSG
jgi:peptide chain release factor 2